MRRLLRNRDSSVQANTLLGSRIPLASLIQVLAVAEYLNFRHAASALGVSQSSVSTRIAALEEDLGILLFERRHRGVRITEAGRRFVAEIAIGVGHLDHAILKAGEIASGEIGTLRMGVPYPVVGGFLANLRRRFRDAYPEVDLLFAEGSHVDLMQKVREGTIDITFVVGAVGGTDCHVRSLWTEAFVVALANDHPLAEKTEIAWTDLASETFLGPLPGKGLNLQDHIVRSMEARGSRPRIRHCEAGRDTIMHMVATGEGIKLTTEAAMHMPFPGVVFRSIVDETEQARFSAAWSPHNRSQALKNLLDLAVAMGRSA